MQALSSAGHRCISLPLSGYDATFPTTSTSTTAPSASTPTFDSAVDDVAASIRAYAQDKAPVVLVCHDWGCLIGYKLQRQYPELVSQLAALDVGNDTAGLTPKELACIVSYQAWLLAAHLVGGGVGDRMTTWFARLSKAPSLEPGGIDHAPGVVSSARNWPYLRYWQDFWREWRQGKGARDGVGEGGDGEVSARGRLGEGNNRGSGAGDASSSGRPSRVPSCPVLYMFGASKPVRFHGDRWLRDVRANGAGSEVIEVDGAGHWFQVTHASHVNEVLLRWLEGTGTLPPSVSQQRSAL